jgi:integrase
MHRLRAGLTRKQLSQYFKGNPSPKSIFNWEHGFYKPTPAHLAAMRAFLKLDVQAILLRAKAIGIKPTGYVFGNGNGGHIGDVKRSFHTACRRAGITDFRFHDLRHTYASHLAMRGVHIRALHELLGHKSVIMTQRYSHLAPEQLQNAVKLLDGVIGGRREGIGRLYPS